MTRSWAVMGAVLLAGAICAIPAGAAQKDGRGMVEWRYEWKPAPGEGTPIAAVCPLKYGKTWAYSVEIDDGPISALTVSQPLLARYAFTDSPPGVPGGKALPFVGGVAIFPLCADTRNETLLSLEQLGRLQSGGWALLNHGYRHIGNSWEPTGKLDAAQIREELFWSQAMLAQLFGAGRAPTHFVYPNGYMDYKPYLTEFGLRSGSRVSGKRCRLNDAGTDFLDMDRNYLDEGVWSKAGGAMAGFPDAPKPGDYVIDFTHGMDADPQSANHRRWQERLAQIAGRYGRAGDDSIWCAPTPEVVAYAEAARAATVRCAKGKLTLSLPASLPGSALTVKLTGIRPGTPLSLPPGGTLFRRGDVAWITTPRLGEPGADPPMPRLHRVYRGPARSVKLDKPARIAGIRLLQRGEPKAGFALAIDLLTPGGAKTTVASEKLNARWGAWLLYALVPERPAVLADQVRVTTDPSLEQMEIWAE